MTTPAQTDQQRQRIVVEELLRGLRADGEQPELVAGAGPDAIIAAGNLAFTVHPDGRIFVDARDGFRRHPESGA